MIWKNGRETGGLPRCPACCFWHCFFRRCAFGTGPGRPGAGCNGRRAGPLSDGLFPFGRRDRSCGWRHTLHCCHLFSLSAIGLSAGIHIAGHIAAALCNSGLWFFLSFSVCCFTAAFGVDGILLAFAVFGLRCMVTLPCYLLLAVSSWEAARRWPNCPLDGESGLFR